MSIRGRTRYVERLAHTVLQARAEKLTDGDFRSVARGGAVGKKDR
jgi:hypothetical protein